MDHLNVSVITMYMTIILSAWIKNRSNTQVLDKLYNKKIRYVNHYLNFQESILGDVTPFCLRIKKKHGITPKSINFLSRWEGILKQAERSLKELLSEKSKNPMHLIETEIESFLHANFGKDLVAERNRLEKSSEKTKQILEERRKHKWKQLTGIKKNSRTRTLEYCNRFKFVNVLDREKIKFMRNTNDSQPVIYQRASLTKMHIIAAIHYWLITLLIPTKC